MGKFLLISILVATFAIPMRAAADPSPARGLRRTVLWLAAFNVAYVIAIVYVLPRLPS
jgi:hypothetical protein